MPSAEIKLLLIEDDQPQAELIRDMLLEVQKQQYAVQHVHYLADGLRLLKERGFDCVIVDLGLPDSQGLETALTVRRQSPDVPIVVLTILDDEEAALNALKLDIQDYLIKGEINRAVLTRSVRYAIQRKAVARQLSESDERLRYASDAANLGLWHWDLIRGDIVFNDKSKALFGFPADSQPGYHDVFAALHPDDRERVEDAVQQALKERTDYAQEMRVILPDGEVRWVASRGHAWYDEQGKPLRMDGINMDVSELKRAEEALRASERKFSRIFRSAPTWMILSTAKEGRIVDINETALEVLGYRREEVIGRTVHDLNLWEAPELRQRVVQDLLTWHTVKNVEISYRCKAGRAITGLLSAELIEIEGEACALMLVRDISERKRTEEALLHAKEEWERTFNSVPDLIAILDTDNRIVRVNRAMAESVGKTPEECVGNPCYAIFHGTDTPPASCPHVKAVAEARQQIAEVQQRTFGAYFLVSYTPLFDRDGNPAGVVHVARDITERKLAERRIEQLNAELAQRADDLEAANRELEAFNYTAAHDLRQPLNTIFGYCQAIEMLCGAQMSAECRGFLGEVYHGVQRMTRLLDALLNFSRMSRVELRRATVDLSATAQDVAKDLKETEPQRGVTFRIREGIEVNGDPALLEIVLQNLMGNAWKYTAAKEDAVIEVGVTAVEGKEAYFVRDNGPGFDMADAAKLFAPFQRLPVAEATPGFGIGLATVERIIQRHGGRVWAEGEPGSGATFYFTLQ